MDGNLCRCTGYRPILKGFSELTQPAGGGCCGGSTGGGCACRASANGAATSNGAIDGATNGTASVATNGNASDYAVAHASQETIFPPALILRVGLGELASAWPALASPLRPVYAVPLVYLFSRSLPCFFLFFSWLVCSRHPTPLGHYSACRFTHHRLRPKANQPPVSKTFSSDRRVWHRYAVEILLTAGHLMSHLMVWLDLMSFVLCSSLHFPLQVRPRCQRRSNSWPPTKTHASSLATLRCSWEMLSRLSRWPCTHTPSLFLPSNPSSSALAFLFPPCIHSSSRLVLRPWSVNSAHPCTSPLRICQSSSAS